jgi:arachidonate 15-lipoxygenase
MDTNNKMETLMTDSATAVSGNKSYQYMHSYQYDNGQVIEPIAVLKVDDDNPFPSSQDLNTVQLVELGEVLVILVANIAINLTNLLNVGAVGPTADPADDEQASADQGDKMEVIIDALKELSDKSEKLHGVIALGKSIIEKAEKDLESSALSCIKDKVEDIGEDIGDKLEKFGEKLVGKFSSKIGLGDGDDEKTAASDEDSSDEKSSAASIIMDMLLKDLVKFLAGQVIKGILTDAGLYGKATSLRQYADQFQTIVVPNVVSTFANDDAFAAQQVSGPNPLVIERVLKALPANFPVEDAAYKKVMGADDSIELAIAENRLYLTDYKPLSVMKPGTFPQQ